jgi:hypothetical protein
MDMTTIQDPTGTNYSTRTVVLWCLANGIAGICILIQLAILDSAFCEDRCEGFFLNKFWSLTSLVALMVLPGLAFRAIWPSFSLTMWIVGVVLYFLTYIGTAYLIGENSGLLFLRDMNTLLRREDYSLIGWLSLPWYRLFVALVLIPSVPWLPVALIFGLHNGSMKRARWFFAAMAVGGVAATALYYLYRLMIDGDHWNSLASMSFNPLYFRHDTVALVMEFSRNIVGAYVAILVLKRCQFGASMPSTKRLLMISGTLDSDLFNKRRIQRWRSSSDILLERLSG